MFVYIKCVRFPFSGGDLLMKNKLNICHIASGDLWAGAEIQVLNIIEGLIEIGSFDISAIIMNRGQLYDELCKLGINIFTVDEKNNNVVKQFCAMRNFISKNAIQVLHSHRYKENIFVSLIKLTFSNKIKLIKTQHGFFAISKLPTTFRMKLYHLLDFFFTKYFFDTVVAVSDNIACQFHGIVHDNKIINICNSINFEKYYYESGNGCLEFDKNNPLKLLKLAAIGRLVKIKNFGELILITKDLNEKGLAIKSFIVGSGPEEGHLKSLVTKYGISKCIAFLGHVNNISDIYNSIDILFITSIHEGIPTVLLEAMYFSKIVVARNVGGIPEVIAHNFNGFLYDDIKDAKKIIQMIYNNPLNYKYIAMNACNTVKMKYGNLIQAQHYATAYRNLGI